MSLEIRLLAAGDEDVLRNVAPGVFDAPVQTRLARDFLGDRRHHLVVARDDGVVVGMVTAVDYVHPDKAPELWINEVGVSDRYRGHGVGRQLVQTLVAHGASLGCREAWVLTSPDNDAAQRMYRAAGAIPHEEPSIMFTYRMGDTPRER